MGHTNLLLAAINCYMWSLWMQVAPDDGKQNFARAPTLGCSELKSEFLFKESMDGGFVKLMELGEISGVQVVRSRPRSALVTEDFRHGVKMLLAFQNSDRTVEVIGYCLLPGQESLVTRYYKHGQAGKLATVIQSLSLSREQEFNLRMQLADDYLSILSYLHNSPVGTRVMCDSNDLLKTLSQYLISDDFHLILADVDALPEVALETGGIKCGRRELFGTFVAPEQLWPWPERQFIDSEMPSYTEKIDIWRVPDVVSFILGESLDGIQLKLSLFTLFQHCKSLDPATRPTIEYIQQMFRSLRDKISTGDNNHSEL